jgi:hypothetical protein
MLFSLNIPLEDSIIFARYSLRRKHISQYFTTEKMAFSLNIPQEESTLYSRYSSRRKRSFLTPEKGLFLWVFL